MQEPSIKEIQDAAARIRAQWRPAIQALVAACQGDADSAAQIKLFLDQAAQKEGWRALATALSRVLAGERDPEPLLADLDDTNTLVVSDTLRALGVDPRWLPSLPGEEPVEDDEGEMVSLENFIQMATRACQADASTEMAEQFRGAAQGMAMQASNPPEIRALGRVLHAVLSGERAPDLAGLPEQLVIRVQQMLEELKGRG